MDDNQIKDLLESPIPHRSNQSTAQCMLRDCWKMHPYDSFSVCQEPSCMFLKAILIALGFKITLNGFEK